MSRPKWEKDPNTKEKIDVVPEVKVDKYGVICNSEMVNFRSSPKVDNNFIQVVNRGTRVKILETYQHWVKVLLNDKEGYVMSGYIKAE